MHGRLDEPPTSRSRTGAIGIARAPFARGFWVIVHRWAGLTIAGFLLIAGLTGSVLPFEEPLTYATRPDAARVTPPAAGAVPLDAVAIAQRVERETGGRIAYLPLDVARDRPARLFVAAMPGRPQLGYDVVWADPYTGKVRLTYTFGGVRDGAQNIVPFLYQLHYGFVAGPWGMLAFGVAALLWTLDCFVGLGLSLPMGGARWLRRLGHAFSIRRWSGFKLTFDLHRAGGLWLWPLLLVFAWSGLALTLPQVETPVRRLLGGETAYDAPRLAKPLETPPLGRRDAIAAGTAAIGRIGARDGFTVERASGLYYQTRSGTYIVYARTSLDALDEGGRTMVTIDARDGRVLHFERPTGRALADKATRWSEMLHMAEVWGLPWKIAVSVVGLMVAVLSATGVMIWSRKRAARLLHRRRSTRSRRARA